MKHTKIHKFKDHITVKTVKIMVVLASLTLLSGIFTTILTLFSVYGAVDKCGGVACSTYLERQQHYFDIGSALTYAGIGLFALSAVVAIYLLQFKHKSNKQYNASNQKENSHK